ncbi:hypothetical protein KAS45_00765 [candidate division WOR-3 bacterium]|nr:hypothetical protein [candidate division WOR-3 bacterium]
MKRKLFVFAILALAVMVSQCAKETDEDAINDLIAADTVYFNTGTEGDSASGEYFMGRDTTIWWWRSPQTHGEPLIAIDIVEDSAWVSWSRDNYGYLRILKTDSIPWLDWSKTLSETAELHATFLRTGTEDDEYRGWQLNTISLAYGVSNTVNTVMIDSVRISCLSYPDLWIIDPLNTYFDIENLITFQPGEPVEITLYTNVADGYAFLHTFAGILPVRLPFTNLGEGEYSGTWNAQLVAIPRFAIFDLMPHSTLYTSDGPYDFNGWLLPYNIAN